MLCLALVFPAAMLYLVCHVMSTSPWQQAHLGRQGAQQGQSLRGGGVHGLGHSRGMLADAPGGAAASAPEGGGRQLAHGAWRAAAAVALLLQHIH